MSLINRMLRDLSTRQPDAGNVMSGIHVPPSTATRPRGSALGRLGLLLVLVAAFTAGLWWMFGPRPIPAPQPRGALTADASLAEPPAPADNLPPPMAEPAPGPKPEAEQKPAHLKMDTELSAAAVPAEAPAAKPAEPAAELPAVEPAPQPRPKKARPVEPKPAEPAPAPAMAEAPAGSGVTPAAPRTPKAEDLYADARRAMQRGDLKAAEAGLIEALAVDPKLHAAREDLGTLRIRQGRLEEAESNVRIGLEADPGWVGYRRLLARLELARRNPAGALEALAGDPPPVESDTEFHALLASAYQRLNRHEEASRTYRALAEVQPDNASWWAGYAMSRDALNDAAGALAGYARARQIGGLDPRVLDHINRRTAVLQSAG